MAERARQLRVEMTRWDYLANLSSRFFLSRLTLEDNWLTFTRNGSARTLVERELKPKEVEEVQALVGQLEQVRLRPHYRRDRRISPTTTVLNITRVEPPFRRRIKMETNPYNPAPLEVMSLVRYLRMLV